MPVRIDQGKLARGIELSALVLGEFEVDGSETVAELVFGAAPDHDSGDPWPTEKPGERHAGAGNTAVVRDRRDRIDDFKERALVPDRRIVAAERVAGAL